LYGSRSEDFDAIDGVIIYIVVCKEKEIKECARVVEFHPFSAETRKTMATFELYDGSIVYASKGAVATLMEDCNCTPETKNAVDAKVKEGAKSGFQSIGVAME
jgi:magnesium-transporting ATPase (P-type)